MYLIIDPDREKRPCYFLVLRGSSKRSPKSRGTHYPLDIHSVHLFESEQLVCTLSDNGVPVGKTRSRATSVKTELWDKAQIYPCQNNKALNVSNEQAKKLALFR